MAMLLVAVMMVAVVVVMMVKVVVMVMVVVVMMMVMLMVVALIISPLTTLALSGQRRPSLAFPSTAEHSPSSTQTQTGEIEYSKAT